MATEPPPGRLTRAAADVVDDLTAEALAGVVRRANSLVDDDREAVHGLVLRLIRHRAAATRNDHQRSALVDELERLQRLAPDFAPSSVCAYVELLRRTTTRRRRAVRASRFVVLWSLVGAAVLVALADARGGASPWFLLLVGAGLCLGVVGLLDVRLKIAAVDLNCEERASDSLRGLAYCERVVRRVDRMLERLPQAAMLERPRVEPRPRGRRSRRPGASSRTASADPPEGPEAPPPPQLRLWRHPVHGRCTPGLLRVLARVRRESA